MIWFTGNATFSVICGRMAKRQVVYAKKKDSKVFDISLRIRGVTALER